MLKSPMHLENLDALRTVFPDATIVWRHHDPVTVAASFCSLIEHGMAVRARPVDLPGIGAVCLDLLSRTVTRGLSARADVPRSNSWTCRTPGWTPIPPPKPEALRRRRRPLDPGGRGPAPRARRPPQGHPPPHLRPDPRRRRGRVRGLRRAAGGGGSPCRRPR
ncbi:sulfotransferase [Streptomyces sp. MB09-02B]|uniref:sulfotransferase n=1 Tax=Streptomyces sp. MB09-02B TaxID=3028667 RepID=UPI0029C095DD|nr:sulfotransferase [Streptomyces sp. MB09-02B]